ncbi:MAG: hypothetical protein WC497_03530 [Patescibacteria group bacterium]
MALKSSWLTGISFGLTSGVITTLGLLTGLVASTNSKMAVLGGIFTIAVADALSDALGMHISQESNAGTTKKSVWEATVATALTKFIIAITFAVPVLLFGLVSATIISVIWGIILVSLLSYRMARSKNEKPFGVIFEHVSITVLVVFLTYFIGDFIGHIFQ